MNGNNWIDDEIINFYNKYYLAEKFPNNLYISSFFYEKLTHNGYNYNNIKPFIKKNEIYKKEKIFIPIHINCKFNFFFFFII